MKTFIFYSALAVIVLNVACDTENSVDVNQDRIETSYTFTYDAHTQERIGTATFKFGRTFLELTPPAEVTVDDKPMTKRDILGHTDYSAKWIGSGTSATFVYRDLDERTFTNTISLTAALTPVDTLAAVSRNMRHFFGWDGAPVQAGEVVWLHVNVGSEYFSASADAIGANSVFVEANELPQLGVGTVYFERVVQPELQQATDAGGSIIASYQSSKVNIQIQ